MISAAFGGLRITSVSGFPARSDLAFKWLFGTVVECQGIRRGGSEVAGGSSAMALRTKWVMASLWLVYSAMALIVLRQYLINNLHGVTGWHYSSTICKGYLLEAAASGAEDLTNMNAKLDSLEWRGGEWFYPPEAFFNNDWAKRYSMPTVCYGNEDHKTRFLVSRATHSVDGVGWGNLKHPFRTMEGHLILQDFWDMRMYYDYMSLYIDYFDENAAKPAEDFYAIDRSQVRNLKILLLGAVVHTGVDQRVCMTGCATRSDLSNQLDCEFVLKMTYPKRRTLMTRHIEAELSSARVAIDPLYFPPFRMVGPSTVSDSEYDFRSEEFLQLALNMTGTSAGNLGGPSRADPQGLATHLERAGLGIYKATLAPTLIEQTLFKRQGMVVVGPFSTPYYPEWEAPYRAPLATDLAEVELTLKFKNIVTTTSNFSGRILVAGSMKMDMQWYRWVYGSETLEQRPYSVEGVWDTTSDKLCMIGCRRDSLIPDLHRNDGIPGPGCDWKICIQSVLRRHDDIHSPVEGAVLSSLYADAQHPGYFTPVRLMPVHSEDDFNAPRYTADQIFYTSAATTPMQDSEIAKLVNP